MRHGKAYTRAARRLACALAAALLGGCFSFKLETPGTPLPPAEVRMRTETRQFAAQMSERVQRVADAIAARSSDTAVQAATLRWKIGASVDSRGAAYRSVPRLALVDTWTFAAQMDAFFRDGAGRELFGERHADAANEAAQIAADARSLAARHLDAAELKRYGDAVARQVADYPLTDLGFTRAAVPLSAVTGEAGAPTTVGSAAEVAADANDRLDAYGRGIPEETRWRMQLLAIDSGVKSADLARLVARTDETLQRVNELADPRVVEEARADLRNGLAQVDRRWGETLEVVQTERVALTRSFEATQAELGATIQRERAAFYQEVDRQRAAFAVEAEHYTTRAIQEARTAVREAIVWGIVVIVLLFGSTFGVGFALGRATRRRSTPG
jgi:hypothetical protein